MDDLNDYRYFTEVVRHGGFSAAGRALRVPKSTLSRRIAGLEHRFGVRLIERTPHRFEVTEVGRGFYEHCRSMLVEAERARAIACGADREPHGALRVAAPVVLVEALLSPVLMSFLGEHPRVDLRLLATDRRVDLIDERIHLALRCADESGTEHHPGTVRRALGRIRHVLVAGPDLAASLPPDPDIETLATLPTVSMVDPVTDWLVGDRWELQRADGARWVRQHEPRLAVRSGPAVLDAVRAGVGVALVPDVLAAADLASGELVAPWPSWWSTPTSIGMETTAARDRLPAVRALVEHLQRHVVPA